MKRVFLKRDSTITENGFQVIKCNSQEVNKKEKDP